jgi:DNA invertase Pin-like site-specific DNA recombinase
LEAKVLHSYQTKPVVTPEPVVPDLKLAVQQKSRKPEPAPVAGTVYGYARVSTTGQTLATQELALKEVGIDKLFKEKVSGVKERRELEKMLAKLQPGDLVIVSKLDRLARSSLDLLQVIDKISKAGAGFKSLGESWADTTTSHGRLMITILSGIAEFERDLIMSRCAEGRTRAMAEGVKFGKKFKLNLHQRKEAFARLDNDEGLRQVAKSYNIDFTALSRLYNKAKAGDQHVLMGE